ncbi:Glycosyltransferase involved in cell wall bisynthesis [Desulfacinum hydrothermale DSM 13146]|uniref:Glycosyltransferase involved in cell wall bisynthesis n=1 Tax=Desulfacinum hydrothermale DSM 13146 TaxID=1121390 RepID=A0A1W1XF13_9BACT|nr:Glycosyltransferase involved in cell wall bisynthesis [Desulfacinum hydrothermale DSM 13146]
MRRLRGIVGKLTAEARRFDVVYVNSKKALLFGALAARRARRPLIWHQRDAMLTPRTLPMRARLSESLLVHLLNRYASRVISVSQASADTLIAAGGRPDLPIVIHNGLDPSRYAQPVDPAAVRRSAGLPLDVALIGCFGRLTRWKGQAVLIDALAHLPEAHVALVGGAFFGESDYEADLRSRVDRLGLTGRVHFLGHRDDVPALMRAVDVVAHPSTEFDPCPRVVLEALHSEAPLVATAVGGVPELVEDGVSGLLVPPNDAPALASALERVLRDRDLAARLAAAGRERALCHFTLDRVVREVERVIGETIGAAN